MVTLKFDTIARAKLEASEELEKYPIVAKIKGSGKDGALSVQIAGDGSTPLSAKISGDVNSPISISPISVAPITVVPDLKLAAETIDIAGVVAALTSLSQGVKVEVANSKAPLAIAIGKIPVDLTISVTSPAQETVFKVEIKGTVGE